MTTKKRARRVYEPLSGRIDRYEYPLPLTVGILSDTHVFAGGGSRQLPGEVLDLFRRFQVDLIVHGGDIVIQDVLDRLATVAPTIAVHGNNEPLELWKELPERIVLSIGPTSDRRSAWAWRRDGPIDRQDRIRRTGRAGHLRP